MTNSIMEQWRRNAHFFKKSYAQVATSLVAMPLAKSSVPAPPKRIRITISVQFTEHQRAIIRKKAKDINLSVNAYIKAVALQADYKPPLNPELCKALRDLNAELTAQGRNLNQIAKHLNGGTATLGQGMAMLDSIRGPLVRALQAVKTTLWQAAPQP
jgi:hypothetical protein